MKKAFSILLVMVIAITAYTVAAAPAGAATLKEREDNDTFDDANLIMPGNTMTGKTMSNYDIDFFKLISNENGKINININIKNPTEGANRKRWWVHTFGPNHEEIGMVNVDLSTASTIVVPFIGAKAGNYYYLAIIPGYGACEGTEYTIRTSFTKGDFYEKEPNNTEEKATDMILGHDYVATIGGDFTNTDSNDCYDNDYFHLKLPARGTLTVTFKHKTRESDSPYCGWDVTLYKHHNGGNATLTHAQFTLDMKDAIDLGSGTMEKGQELWLCVKSGRELYYHAHESSDIQGEPYKLSTKFTLWAKPTLSASTTKSAVTLTAPKLADVTGYQIQTKNGSTFGDTATVSKAALEYTKSGLRAGTSYTFRVRAYLKKDNTEYYGDWVTVTAKTKAGANTIITGDADGDGKVSVMDATRIQRWLAKLCNINGKAYTGATPTAAEIKAADADGDGKLTVLDATAIQRYTAGLKTNKNIGKTA